MDKLVIVSEKYLTGLQKRSALMMLGWIVAWWCIVSLVFLVRDYHKQIEALKTVQEKQAVLDISQRETTLAFIKAWENQQETTKTIMAYSEYIKNREDLSRYNAGIKDKLPQLTANLGAKRGP